LEGGGGVSEEEEVEEEEEEEAGGDGSIGKGRHPRVACLDRPSARCRRSDVVGADPGGVVGSARPPSIPTAAGMMMGGGGAKNRNNAANNATTSNDSGGYVRASETGGCKLADPTYQAAPAAPPTCNDVHALAFRFFAAPSSSSPARSVGRVYPSNHHMEYLTHGGYREVWKVTQLLEGDNDDDDGTTHVGTDDGGVVRDTLRRVVIMKTNKVGKKGWSTALLDKHRRDVLVGERAGTSPLTRGGFPSETSNVCPVYQCCAFTSVSPYSDVGPLDAYVEGRKKKKKNGGGVMGAIEVYVLAMQAARGLHQAQLYRDGMATNVHADVKPDQLLLFRRPGGAAVGRRLDGGSSYSANADDDDDDDDDDESGTTESTSTTTRAVLANPDVPLLQIQDFNRGRYLTRSIAEGGNNATCPFRMCGIRHRGSTYRSPEEYMDCADQADTIDVYALGGVFYYLLSDGRRPWYYVDDYDTAVERILGGETSRLPDDLLLAEQEEERDDGGDIAAGNGEEREEEAARRRERSTHPAFVALREVMMKCWEYKPEDRPSSLRVVQMLEDKWNEMIAPTILNGYGLES
jgi:serine/threonine protein kinase